MHIAIGDSFGGHTRIDHTEECVYNLLVFHHGGMSSLNAKEQRQRMGEHRLDAAPWINHFPFTRKIFFMEATGHVDNRGKSYGVIFAFAFF